MMTCAEIDGIIRRFTTSEDVTRPGLSRPWRTPSGCVVATDGRIAIACRNVPSDLYRYDAEDADLSRSRQILKWISEDTEDANLGFRVPIPLDFVEMERAAGVALSDARSYFKPAAWHDLDEDGFDDEERDTPDDFARRNSAVVMPGPRRTQIAAWYAATVAVTVKAFGGKCAAYDWLPGKRPPGRRKCEYSRLLFVGEDYDIILMPLRLFSRATGARFDFDRSIADAATGRLVKSYGDVAARWKTTIKERR